MKARILYVEDDQTLSFITTEQLQEADYDVVHRENGSDGLSTFKEEDFDLAILDIMLPEMDGFTLAKEIRALDENIPILFLSAKSLEEDRLTGFELGADDYLTKPFSLKELLYKIKVFLKRSEKNVSPKDQKLEVGSYVLNTSDLSLSKNGHSRTLTAKESDLLYMLASNANNTVKREDILVRIWGKNDYFLGRSLDVFISRLRKYLDHDPKVQISTVRGVGFRLELEETP